ncbi:Crp/Fnr family transcriptional regulator [Granulosicoccus antarcticus]|uniref:Nitrogen fixation regulation protein FixK n=1 Tax=Granulosicoccus antarcticus IMCC3135 TaxID=1192854 RepID=A0A2Z2NU18_9GAMM|nr:Crp/Fnr family transcriptional regulator [Granulosicoccus antarcticus]ASJ72260.1 Nitrogen fixation regulation protein FixK [Granulosicoccus antarcticus IMCC3135]
MEDEHIIKKTALARKLGAFVDLSGAELSVLEGLHKQRRTFVAGCDLVRQGQSGQSAYILLSGWACAYKTLVSGQRQIVNFQIPGDFLGLRSVLLKLSDHSVEPVSDIEVTEVLLTDLLTAFTQTPRLATAIFWAVSRDEAMIVEHLVDIGRRNAAERMAHFLLELGARLSLVGMGSKEGYACPLSQYMLADALGLSSIHINRVLRQLREAGMVTFRNGFVAFQDYDQLVEFAEFDPVYLDQTRPLLPLQAAGKVHRTHGLASRPSIWRAHSN